MDTYPVITRSNRPAHVGMSPRFFDEAVRRAFDAELCIMRTNRPGTVAVSSGTNDEVDYMVTATSCGCAGHARMGRCYHRAFYLFFAWMREQERAAERQTEREPA